MDDDDDDDWHNTHENDDEGHCGYVMEDPVGGYVSMMDGVQMGYRWDYLPKMRRWWHP
jgi:hypothetical protein